MAAPIYPRWTGIRAGATYRFWRGHALLLVKTMFLRPRNSRGETATCSGKWPRRSIRDGLAFARVQPTGFGEDTPYSSSKRCFCIRETVAVKPQRVRENGRADISAMDWHSRGCNLPVLERTRLTPRQNDVFASAKQSR